MLHQVVGSVFGLMEEYAGTWRPVRGSEPAPTFGFAYSVGLEPIHVNLDRMMEMFRLGIKDLGPFYRSFLPQEVLAALDGLAGETDRDRFVYPDEAWVRTVLSFALACHRQVASREHIIKSLTPLYLGKVASFVIATWDSSAEDVEKRLEELCLAFERDKDYLVGEWESKA